jgi:hypothetical protein
VFLNDIEYDARFRSSALDPIPSGVLSSVVDGHGEADDQTERLEGQVQDDPFGILWSLGGGEGVGSEHGETLSDRVQHSETDRSLGLRTAVVGLPTDDDGDRTVPCTNDRDASKVTDVQGAVGGVNGGDAEEDRPTDDSGDVDCCGERSERGGRRLTSAHCSTIDKSKP